MKRASQTVKRDEILTVRALFVICTRVTWKMHSFSANPKRVEFFLYIIREVIYHQKMNGILGLETVLNELEALNIFFVPY